VHGSNLSPTLTIALGQIMYVVRAHFQYDSVRLLLVQALSSLVNAKDCHELSPGAFASQVRAFRPLGLANKLYAQVEASILALTSLCLAIKSVTFVSSQIFLGHRKFTIFPALSQS
jgi:hypothetical protein